MKTNLPDYIYKGTRKSVRERQMDMEANYFAICLLLDEESVRREVRRLAPEGFDLLEDPAIPKLAKKFAVTEQLMVIRLCELGYFDFTGFKVRA